MVVYIRRKCKILRQLGIELTGGEMLRLMNAQTEIAADNIVRAIIVNNWEV